jgi:hypothetical protein
MLIKESGEKELKAIHEPVVQEERHLDMKRGFLIDMPG